MKDAGKAIGSLMGGLFKKKKTDEPQDAAGASPPAGQAADTKVPDQYAQYLQLAAFSMETVSISTDAIPAARFDIPPDWTKEVPKPAKGGDDEFTCPKT